MPEVIDIIKKLRAATGAPESARFAPLFKDATFTASSSATQGLTWYDLEPSVKFLVPLPTPLADKIPRVSGKGGIEADWAAIVGLNGNRVRAGVDQGNRGGVIAVTTQRYTATYKTLGLEGSANYQAQWAGQGLDDIYAEATLRTLQATKLQEEYTILGGNSSFALNGGNATPSPTVTDTATGGLLLHNQAYSVICVALSFDALNNGTIDANGVQGMTTRTNADGSTTTYGGGAAKVSIATSHTTASSPTPDTYVLNASLAAPIVGAFGYAWYVATTAGQEKIVAITTLPSVTITALPAAGNQLASALGSTDGSANQWVFDGLLYQALKAGSGSYVASLSGTLTGDNAGGIVEIDAMLKSMYDTSRLGPNILWVSSQEALNIGKKVLAGGSTGTQRFVFTTMQDALKAGTIVREYLNKWTGETIEIRIHPNMPAGCILATSDTIPYALSGVGNVMQMRMRQDYFQIQWPLRSLKREFGCYLDGVLQHYFPASMGVIYNITNG